MAVSNFLLFSPLLLTWGFMIQIDVRVRIIFFTWGGEVNHHLDNDGAQGRCTTIWLSNQIRGLVPNHPPPPPVQPNQPINWPSPAHRHHRPSVKEGGGSGCQETQCWDHQGAWMWVPGWMDGGHTSSFFGTPLDVKNQGECCFVCLV